MANLTIAIDDELLQAARVKAVQQGTSVNEICRQAIEAFARPEEAALQGAQALLAALDKARAETRRVAAGAKRRTGSGPAWPGREALYDEVMSERGLLPASRKR
jgi:plasmid stability protein